jgi:hypothetical protein
MFPNVLLATIIAKNALEGVITSARFVKMIMVCSIIPATRHALMAIFFQGSIVLGVIQVVKIVQGQEESSVQVV